MYYDIWILFIMFILGGIFALFGGLTIFGRNIGKPSKDLRQRVAYLESQIKDLKKV
jgi:hypothetical protein